MHRQKSTQRVKGNEERKKYVSNTEQDKTPETDLNKIKIRDLSDKDFKIMIIINLLTKIRRTMHRRSEKFNKDRKFKKIPNISRRGVFRNTITELKHSIEEFNSRLVQANKKIDKLIARAVEFIQSEKQKE